MVGRAPARAKLLLGLGYQTDAPEALESDLRTQHLPLDPTRTSPVLHETALQQRPGRERVVFERNRGIEAARAALLQAPAYGAGVPQHTKATSPRAQVNGA
jgi:hypothetical protein